MKKHGAKNYRFLYTGLLFCSAAQIFVHFYKVPDFVSGCLMGFGIGIMLLSFSYPKKKRV